MHWNNQKEEKRWTWYLLGFGDGVIGALSEPFVSKSGVCSWRFVRGLSPNKGLVYTQGYPFSEERKELLLALYNEGLNDAEIGRKVHRAASNVRRWRIKKGLPANAAQGGQARHSKVDKLQQKTQQKAVKQRTKRELKEKPKKGKIPSALKMGVRPPTEEAERAIVEGLPTKEQVYQKVRNSPSGQVTTKQLIKEEYGDVGSKRRDTIGKLRELVDEDGLLQLDTSGKEIVWIA